MKRNFMAIIFIFSTLAETKASIILERVVCTAVDANFTRIDLCELKPNKEKIPSFSLTMELLKVPVTNCIINTQAYNVPEKQALLISNRTWDGCEAMRSARRISPAKFVLNLVKEYTNINHTCPYSHPIILRNLRPNRIPLPVPPGKYIYKMSFIVDGERRFALDFYAKIR